MLYGVAAVAFTRQSRAGDELLGWVGAGCMLAAGARVCYLLFPSLYTDWLYAGDLLRLDVYVLLLVGAVREIRVYWEAAQPSLSTSERRARARAARRRGPGARLHRAVESLRAVRRRGDGADRRVGRPRDRRDPPGDDRADRPADEAFVRVLASVRPTRSATATTCRWR